MLIYFRLTANTLSQLQKRTGPLTGTQNTETDADTIMEMIKSLQNEIEVRISFHLFSPLTTSKYKMLLKLQEIDREIVIEKTKVHQNGHQRGFNKGRKQLKIGVYIV